jgi:hypothetical protein
VISNVNHSVFQAFCYFCYLYVDGAAFQETNPGCGGPISTQVSVLLVVVATVLTLALARLS